MQAVIEQLDAWRAGELRGDAGFRDLLAGAAAVECSDLADPHDVDTREDLEVVRR